MEEEIKAALLASGFQTHELVLEETPSGGVGGFVISNRFADLSQIERQDHVWKTLRL